MGAGHCHVEHTPLVIGGGLPAVGIEYQNMIEFLSFGFVRSEQGDWAMRRFGHTLAASTELIYCIDEVAGDVI